MSEGVGNPVYDTFNEGQPLEDVSYFIHLKAWTVSWLSSSFFQLYQLRVLVRSGTWPITREWQNHSFLSNKYISQALYQRLQTTKIMNFEKLRKPARFQNPQLQSVQYSSIRPSNLLFYLCYLHILLMFWAVTWCFTQFGGSSHCLDLNKCRETAFFNFSSMRKVTRCNQQPLESFFFF